MNSKVCMVLTMAMTCGSVALGGAELEAGIAKLKSQFIKTEVAGGQTNKKKLQELAASQREDGSWSHVDYTNQTRSYWPTAQHVSHLLDFARSLHKGHDAVLEAAYHRGLKYWLDAGLKNPNWWWNEIGVPQQLGLSALLAETYLSPEEIGRIVKALEVSTISGTGQNRVWLSRIVMMRGMLAQDAELVKTAVGEISGELRITDREGIREDWCFHQHGRQPQFGNYGGSFIDTMSRFAIIVAGTPFEFPPEKIELLRRLLTDGYRWIVWNGMMDVSCLGRQLMTGSQAVKGRNALNCMNRMRRAGYEIPQEGPWGFKYFFKSAFAVYRSAGGQWMGSVRMSTPEVIGVETWINSEATQGGHMADGALMMYSTGHEYEDIFPLWNNWRLIPGITTYLSLPPVSQPKNGFNGGANEADEITVEETDGKSTLTFLLKRDGLTARKTYQFTADGVVASGKEITADNEASEVITCVEQSLAQKNAKIYPYENGCLRAVNGDFEYRIEAPETSIVAVIEERVGNPRSVMPRGEDMTVKGKVFSVYIRHGVKPQGATYRYSIQKHRNE